MSRIFLTKLLRLSLGFIFLWAFFDKLMGLGFATSADKAWIRGGSPTSGYLSFATKGPFAEYFQTLSGIALVDWLFMLGILFVGLALVFRKYLNLGVSVGVVLMVLMYLSAFPPANNPAIDQHIIYALLLLLIAKSDRS